MAAITMSMSAREVFDVKLYNSRPPYDNGDSQDTAKGARSFPMRRRQQEGAVICPGRWIFLTFNGQRRL